ncbi:hypothetical protein A9K58_00420 [Stenotrophomonas maltophilia]|uniref:Peptidase n=1 Tax=Stenotrophomonas maltophilia TaxID=40324 RepID=A0A1A6Y689_STEMA|nr:hypothetical protein [Stenotrophomonas maltophilia]OBU70450.1 hypothetical protein A9K58_00420 [Stenotrophomonas maltophilia]
MSTESATTTSTQNSGEGEGSNTTTSTTGQQGTGGNGQSGTEGTRDGGDATGANGKDTQGNDGKAGKPDGDTAAGAPEQYEAFKVPDGFVLEGDRLGQATEFFKAKGWTQEQAQEAIDLYTSMAGEDAGALQQAVETQRLQQIEQWGTETKQQLGSKYDETVSLATTAVKAINDPELTKAFNELGWGNHPAMVNAFAFMGRFLRDSPMDGLGGSTTSAAGERSLGQRMYPDMK